MPVVLEAAAAFVAGYAVGSVPLGLVVAYLAAGIDIRRYGTGNVGAANVREHVGRAAAAVVALGVFLQGLVPPLVARLAGAPEAVVAAAALGPVVGYGWSPFLGFKGGRALGVATGAATAISPGGFLVLLGTYALGAILKQTSPATLLAFALYAGYVFLTLPSPAYRAAALLLLVLVAARRLEGVGREVRRGPPLRAVLELLIFQRRQSGR